PGSEPGSQPVQRGHPLGTLDVIEHVGAEHEVGGRGWLRLQDGLGDHLRRGTGPPQLVAQRVLGLDRDGAFEAWDKPGGHLPVARAGVDEDPPGRQRAHQVLQPGPRVRLLIRVIEEDLEGAVIGLALGAIHGDRLHVLSSFFLSFPRKRESGLSFDHGNPGTGYFLIGVVSTSPKGMVSLVARIVEGGTRRWRRMGARSTRSASFLVGARRAVPLLFGDMTRSPTL